MIYIKFTVDSRLKKIISSNKKYSLQEASSILEKLEEHTKNNKSIESVEYSILENQDLLFRDRYITKNGNQTDIILLVKETLDTVFRDYPQGEKDLLLNKLDKAMNENIDSSYEERQYGIESEFKQEEEERINQIELELKREKEEKRNHLESELKQEIEEKRKQLELELKQEKETINNMKNNLKKDLNKEKLLKKYIKKNEKLKKTMYKRNNIVFSISKIIFMICCIIIGLSLYKNLLKL